MTTSDTAAAEEAATRRGEGEKFNWVAIGGGGGGVVLESADGER